MKKFIIGFSKSNKKLAIGSWLIRFYQNTKFSHTYVKVNTPFLGSDTYVHASEGKVLRMSEPQFKKRHKKIIEFEIEVTDQQYQEIVKDLHYTSGDDYGMMQNFGILLLDILKVIDIEIKNPWQKGWNCSEFVCSVLIKSNPDLVNHLDPQTVTPKQLYNILKNNKIT